MSNRQLAVESGRARRRNLLVALVVGIMLPALAFAQPITRQAKSALYFVLGEQMLFVTVVEVGNTREPSYVSIRVLDAADNVRASVTNKVLGPGNPVRLRVPAAAGSAQQLRAVVSATASSDLELHALIVSMEVFNPGLTSTTPLPPCTLAMQEPSEPGAEPNCPGWDLPR